MAKSIAVEYRDHLGDWITHRFTKGVEVQERNAASTLFKLNLPENELREQWSLQKKIQTSARASKSVNHRKAKMSQLDDSDTIKAEKGPRSCP